MTTSFIKENNFDNCILAIRGVQNYNKSEAEHIMAEAKVNHDTQFYRRKGGDEVPPPPPPQSTITFERVDEI